MRLTIDKQTEYGRELLTSFEKELGKELVEAILNANQSEETSIEAQLVIESKEPSIPISAYAYNETRYKMLTQMDKSRAEE